MASPSSSSSTTVWQGTTPAGYSLRVERDERNRWVATVATASRSRNASLEAALLEAGGDAIPRHWALRLAAAIIASSATKASDTHRRRA